jgi:hypothetical protein
MNFADNHNDGGTGAPDAHGAGGFFLNQTGPVSDAGNPMDYAIVSLSVYDWTF